MTRMSDTQRCVFEALECRTLLDGAGPDLTAALADKGMTLPGVLVPGDAAKIPVVVANAGDTRAWATINVRAYLSVDAVLDAGDAMLGELSRATRLLPGKSATLTISAKVPGNFAPGEYYLLVVVDPDNAVEESDEANNLLAEATARPVVWRFGSFDGRTNVPLTLAGETIAAAGTTTTFTMTGPGYGEITPYALPVTPGHEPGYDLELVGTTAASAVKVAGQDVGPKLRTVQADGSLKSFEAGNVKLVGNFVVSGTLGKLTLGDVVGQALDPAEVTIDAGGAGGGALAMTLGMVRDAVIEVGQAISSFQAVYWLDGGGVVDGLTAASIAKFAVGDTKERAGDFEADLTLTGAAGLGTANVVGDLRESLWQIAGGLKSLTVGGAVDGCTVQTGGAMGSLTMGQCLGSDFLAGVEAGGARHATDASQFDTSAQINSIVIRGPVVAKGEELPRCLVDSNFSAARINTTRLLNPMLDNAGNAFGLFVLGAAKAKPVSTVVSQDTELGWDWQWRPKSLQPFVLQDFVVQLL